MEGLFPWIVNDSVMSEAKLLRWILSLADTTKSRYSSILQLEQTCMNLKIFDMPLVLTFKLLAFCNLNTRSEIVNCNLMKVFTVTIIVAAYLCVCCAQGLVQKSGVFLKR